MGELAALGTALLWALSSAMVGSQTKRVPIAVIGAVQLTFATAILWLATGVLLLGGVIHGTTAPRALALIGSALIGPGVGDLLYYGSIRTLGVARTFPVAMAASPLFTIVLAAVVVGESITPSVIGGGALIVAGITLITLRPESVGGPGAAEPSRGAYLIVLVAAGCWAVATVWLRAATEGLSPPLVSSIRIPAAALFALALARSQGVTLRPGRYGARSIATLGAAGLLGVGAGSILYVLAVQHAGAARTAILSSTAPLFALPLAAILLHERVTSRIAAGTALSIAGIWLVAS